jgi:WD40 repeat protein
MDDWICCQTLDSHSSTVWDIDFDQSGDRLVSVGDDRALKGPFSDQADGLGK